MSPTSEATSNQVGIPIDPALTCFRFLDLPPELRVMIYQELFLHTEDVIVIDYGSRHSVTYKARLEKRFELRTRSQRIRFSSSVKFLRACKQIYTEANKVLYGQNIFHVPYFYTTGSTLLPIEKFLKNKAQQSGLVRKIKKEVDIINCCFAFKDEWLVARSSSDPDRHYYDYALMGLRRQAEDTVAKFLKFINRPGSAFESLEIYALRGNASMTCGRWAMKEFLTLMMEAASPHYERMKATPHHGANRQRVHPKSFEDLEIKESEDELSLSMVLAKASLVEK
ncbi:MAG: hypothetical protein MMC33_004969 [Icmadophila ericetorum]|nr:hypothetical protein [Icmadophila ericetorum]